MPTRSSSLSSSSNNNNDNNSSSINKAIPTVAFLFFTTVIVSIASVIVMNKSLLISFSSSQSSLLSSSLSSSPPITTDRKNIINHNKVSTDGGRLIVTTEDEEPDSSVTFNNNNNNNNNKNNIKNKNENKNKNKTNIKTKNENKEVEKSISSATAAVNTKQSESKGRGANKNKINSNNKKKNTKSGRNEKAAATATIEELDDDDADDGCNIKEDQMGGTTIATTIKEEGSNLQLPLRPPYYILQIGEPRSGSTFQAQLLMAITDLKSKGTTETETSTSSTSSSSSSTNTILFRNSPNPNMRKQQKANKNIKENGKHRTNQIYQGKDFFQQIVQNGFVQKSHDTDWIEKTICELEKLKKHNHIAVFNSVVGDSDNTRNINDGLLKKSNLNYDIGYSAHQQIMKSTEFRNCSLCEIDNYYKPIFDLSINEITILKLYMSKYQLIRQCCGLQMSKYNRLRLHGCNVTEYQTNPLQHSYPWCEKHDMNEIEIEFDTLLKDNNMIYRSMDGEEDSKWTWMKLGDCQKFDEQIISGMDFNGARFDGNCTSLDSVDTTNKNFYTRSNNARKKRKEEKK